MLPKPTSPLYIGLMSGTSMDGVDGVLAAISDDGTKIQTIEAAHVPFPDKLRTPLFELQTSGNNEIQKEALAANQLVACYSECVGLLLQKSSFINKDINAIGAHGQTIRHQPEFGYTRQVNNPSLLAEVTKIPVIADFRSRDIAAHGQGAPLVPAFHQAFFGDMSERRVIVNIGGFSNITVLPNKDKNSVLGFDTGPGNVLMDGWTLRHRGQNYDHNGHWAEQGKVNPALLSVLLADPFFKLLPPKSTGRDHFNLDWLDGLIEKLPKMSNVDVQTTLCEFTAITIAKAVIDYAPQTQRVYLCGGGAYNECLFKKIETLLGKQKEPIKVLSTQVLGVAPEHVEALAFAWLAHRFMVRLPGNLPVATGAEGPRILGGYFPAGIPDYRE